MILRILKNGQRQAMPFVGMYEGMDCFLVCPGPSLKDVDPAILDCPGAFVLGVNTSYPKVKPDVWIGMDAPDSYDPAIIHERFPKFYGTRYVGVMVDGRKLEEWPQSYFLGPGKNGTPEDFFAPQDDKSEVIWNGNTYETAIHTALRMGAKTIYLVGCDFGGPSDYYDGRTLAEEHRKRNQSLYRILADKTRALAEAAKFHDKEIISCTPGSPVNQHIGYLPLAEAAGRARCNASFNPARPKVDAELAEKLCWTPMKDPGYGVMVGCDASLEWALPWWYENYRLGNDYRVAWIDFGLSPNALAWCQQRGTVINCIDLLSIRKTWSRKPFAMLRSPWGTTIYMDIDCEVRGNLGPLFNQVGNDVLATDDPYNPWSKQYVEVPVATGLLGFRHGNPDLMEWARYMLAHPDLHGDQEGFNALVGERKMHVNLMDRKIWQWLRLDGQPPEAAKVVHWTGPEGKDIIRAKIGGGVSPAGAPVRFDTAKAGGLVSILMPAYNAEKWITQAVLSCAAQTYENWELIIVDDGSTDNTAQFAKLSAETNPRVKFIQATHAGYVASFNAALKAAQGEYIAKMDADDDQRPDRLAQQIAALIAHSADLCTCSEEDIDEDGKVIRRRNTVAMEPASYVRNWAAGKDGENHNPICPCIVARKSAYDVIGGYDSPEYGPDTRWNFRAIQAGLKWTHVDERMYSYRRHPAQMTHTTMEGGRQATIDAAAALAGHKPTIIGLDWLDPKGEMRFSKPVVIAGAGATLPSNLNGEYKVWLTSTEPASSRNPAANPEMFDLVLDGKALPFGESWVDEPERVAAVPKTRGVSFLCTAKGILPGHKVQQEVWERFHTIKPRGEAWISSRSGQDAQTFPVPQVGCARADKGLLYEGYTANIAVENTREDDYFTEKLIDCFLTKTVPIYWGCPNIGQYFDTAGMMIAETADDIIRLANEYLKATIPATAVEENCRRAKQYARPMRERVRERVQSELDRPEYWQTRKGLEAASQYQDNPEGFDIVKMASSMLRECGRVVDMGCGIGRYAKGFDPAKYVGVDINQEALRAAAKANPDYQFFAGDAFPAGDGYLFMTVLLHYDDAGVSRFIEGARKSGAGTILVGEMLGHEWRRLGNPPAFNRELQEYLTLFYGKGYDLVDLFYKPCKRYVDDPSWAHVKNKDVAIMKFRMPQRGHRSELARLLGPDSLAVEVGVWEGVFSRALLSGGRGKVFSVDPWSAQPGDEYHDYSDEDQASWDRRAERVKNLLRPYGLNSQVLRKTSEEAVIEFTDETLTLVYLDANHAYESIRKDIALWWPKVKPGGALAGHDFTTNDHCGVELAVREFCAEQKLTPGFLMGDGPPTWAIKKPCPA